MMLYLALTLMVANTHAQSPAPPARQFAYLTVSSQPAEDLLEVLRPMVGGGTLMAHRDQLIVQGTPDEIAAVRAGLAQLDRPPRRLMIEVRLAERVGGRGQQFNTNTLERLVQRVQTLDGRAAQIRTGEWRPMVTGGGPWGVSRDLQVLDSGFQALPRVHGEEVTVEIDQQREEPRPNDQARTSMAETVIRGRLGEWLELGGEQQREIQTGTRRWSTEDLSAQRLQLRVLALD
jgi:hypothetical protein